MNMIELKHIYMMQYYDVFSLNYTLNHNRNLNQLQPNSGRSVTPIMYFANHEPSDSPIRVTSIRVRLKTSNKAQQLQQPDGQNSELQEK